MADEDDIAGYIATLTRDLKESAAKSHFDDLAYILALAEAEARAVIARRDELSPRDGVES